jgi:hypothetical protein
MKYTLTEFSDILFSGNNLSLPDSVNLIIKKLVSDLGVSVTTTTVNNDDPSYKKTTSFNSLNPRKAKNVNKRENIEDNWKPAIPFKATSIQKKEGVEKSINDIRVCLNKISSKNYDAQRDSIIQLINDVTNKEDGDSDIELNLVSQALFDIASTNKFYSELYANLYKELSVSFPNFENNISKLMTEYMKSIDEIIFVDQNIDYDKFCDNNKVNDKRKAVTTFIVNLMKNEVVEKKKVIEIINDLLAKLVSYVDEDNRLAHVEEITEIIFIFVTLSCSSLKTMDEWVSVVNNIKLFSQFKAKEHKSISSRAIFKHLDILDYIKKN